MAKVQVSMTMAAKPKITRKGVVAKSKTSKIKNSKNYKKRSVGQG
jgi:hypothetical protein